MPEEIRLEQIGDKQRDDDDKTFAEPEKELTQPQEFTLSERGNFALQIGNTLLVYAEGETYKEATTLSVKAATRKNKERIKETFNTPIDPEFPDERVRDELTLVEFGFEAANERDREKSSFNKNVRFVVDLRGYGIDLDRDGGTFFIEYEDEENPGRWIEVPIEIYQRDGLITAETDHFSNWAAGWRPEAWGVTWSPPTVAEFSGSTALQYAIDVPPGRAGLQPSVNFSYSSGKLVGRIPDRTSQTVRPYDPVGEGWSLGQVGIFRNGGKYEAGVGAWVFPERFTLTVDGVGHTLIPHGQEAVDAHAAGLSPQAHDVEYYAQENPGIRVIRHNWNLTANGTAGAHWTVEMPSGLIYWIGSATKGRQLDCRSYNVEFFYPFSNKYSSQYSNSDVADTTGTPPTSTDPNYPVGSGDRCVVVGWYVNKITDPSGNEIIYNYTDTWKVENIQQYGTVKQEQVRVTRINYNFKNQNPTDPGTVIVFTPETVNRIEAVEVYHGYDSLFTSTPIKKYRLNQTGESQDSQSCVKSDGTRSKFTFYLLNYIEEQAYDHVSNQWVSLPQTEFTY
ncbi:MAG: hypothetical protein AAF633_21335, partial [Chloroflexota bacterium]